VEQVASARLIETPENYFEETKREYEARRDVVFEALRKMPGVVCEKPTGAFYLVVKLPVRNAEDFVRWLLTDFSINNETVMLAPAEGFYATKGLGVDEVRISYCLNCDDLRKAMNIISIGHEEYEKTNNR
jgi:aspartate aminotransferase